MWVDDQELKKFSMVGMHNTICMVEKFESCTIFRKFRYSRKMIMNEEDSVLIDGKDLVSFH